MNFELNNCIRNIHYFLSNIIVPPLSMVVWRSAFSSYSRTTEISSPGLDMQYARASLTAERMLSIAQREATMKKQPNQAVLLSRNSHINL